MGKIMGKMETAAVRTIHDLQSEVRNGQARGVRSRAVLSAVFVVVVDTNCRSSINNKHLIQCSDFC